MTRTIDDEAAVDSDSDDYIDESAIDDDDDSSDWEDATEESDKPYLTSRRSLITLMLTQNDQAHNIGGQASQSTSTIPRYHLPNGPSLAVSPNDPDEVPPTMKGLPSPGLKPIHEVPGSTTKPIMTGPNQLQPQAAISPRTN
ncbi:hypothetical protein ACHAPK_011832, partial [Fusarium culmorum]